MRSGLTALVLLLAATVVTAQEADAWERWSAFDPGSTVRVDHSEWARFLDSYLVTDTASGVTLVRYREVTPGDRRALERYVVALQGVEVRSLTRNEQLAFWINLYNAATVELILDHYPVDSIRSINISPGLFARGPWGAKILVVDGVDLSLDDIEHRILRPLWNDPRIHYAVNCASIGCPNLQAEPFTAANADRLLTSGAAAYVNHPRGVTIERGRMTLSSIYDWFQEDFGGNEDGVVEHLLRYAEPSLAAELRAFDGRIRYAYDWSLNEP